MKRQFFLLLLLFSASFAANINTCQEIDESGSYILTANITAPSGDSCLDIVWGVLFEPLTIDCNGYSIIGNGSTYGINIDDNSMGDVEFHLLNCKIYNFNTGVYAHSGQEATSITIDDTTFFNNSKDMELYGDGTLSFNHLIFASDSSVASYSNVSFDCSATPVEVSYGVNSTGLNTMNSFAGYFFNATTATSCSNFVFDWTDTQLSGYNESRFYLHRYSGGAWNYIDVLPNWTENKFTTADATEGLYGIFQWNGTVPPVYFFSTPPNDTANFTYPLSFSVRTDPPIRLDGCEAELDAVNATGSLSSNNISCGRTLGYSEHLFNNTYDAIVWVNVSGSFYATNETRVVPYYGCGYVNSNATMLGNVIAGFPNNCFYLNASDITLDCDSYTIRSDGLSLESAIISDDDDRVTIKNCDIADFNTCIYLVNSLGSSISDSTCDSGGTWIYLENFTYGNLFNIIHLGSTSGGSVWGGSNYNNFTNITITGDARLDFEDSDYNIITGTTFNSGTFIPLTFDSDCDYNLIYNNVFNESGAVSDDSSTNYWNTTKTLAVNIIGGNYIGGNYYADYLGVDTDGDGIGNTLVPYSILTASYDYLPLTNKKPVDGGMLLPAGIITLGVGAYILYRMRKRRVGIWLLA